MKKLLVIVLLISITNIYSQRQKDIVKETMEMFHYSLVNKVGHHFVFQSYLDDSLSYGHSNGWVQTKKEFIDDMYSKIIYHSFKEDSIQVVINGSVAHARFVADIAATLNGKEGNYHLKVLEVWVRKEKRWLLFARQAVK